VSFLKTLGRLIPGLSSITVPSANGSNLKVRSSTVLKERTSLVRPSTPIAGMGLPHGAGIPLYRHVLWALLGVKSSDPRLGFLVRTES
jgi:hypothetical protein